MPGPAPPFPAGGRRLSGCLALAVPLLLAGVLPLDLATSGRWGWSGSWVYPVGDPHTLSGTPAGDGAGYRVTRGVSDRDSGGTGHQGVDLSNGGAGGPVRAAASGLVVAVGKKGWNRGYGRDVVLGHRSLDATLVYSVYAHLAPGSVTVHPGQFVDAGSVIGRVGMTGRATSPHLHFEVRVAAEAGTRWEKATVVDPLAFVAARLPTPRADSSWAQPYLEWAEFASLIRSGEDGDRPPTRAEWWRTLAAAIRQRSAAVPVDADSLRGALVDAGVLPDDIGGDPKALLEWREVARDLGRALDLGLRLPVSPIGYEARRGRCQRELGVDSPAHDPMALAEGLPGHPTRAELCLVLADLAGDAPRQPKTPKRRATPPRPAG